MNELIIGIITGVLGTLITTGLLALWNNYTNSPNYRGRKIRNLLKKAKILWLGPIHSGKSSLLNHFASPDLITELPTTHGIETLKIPSLNKATILVCDQEPDKSADIVRQFRPTILIIQVAVQDFEHEFWLKMFLYKFVEVLSLNPEKVSQLRRILIIVSKIDLVSEKKAQQRISEISHVIDENFKPIFEKRPKQIEILMCSLLKNHDSHTKRIMNYLMSGFHLDPITSSYLEKRRQSDS